MRVGARLTTVVAVAGLAYALAESSGAHRAAIVALFAAVAAWGHVPIAHGADRLVEHGRLLAGWSAVSVLLCATIVALDGGIGSPLALLLVLPVVFAGLSFPQRSVVAIGIVDVAALVAVGAVTGASQPALAFFLVSLAAVALLCAWEAQDHERQRSALARVSRADPLTGCLNRRGFEERFDSELDGCRRSGRRAGVVVLDLDDFKLVNDTRGHEAGDELLRWTVDRANGLLRPMDALGRVGGDEFALLVPGAGPAEAREVAARLRDALGERVSVSYGVASYPVDGVDRDSLQRRADHDLYAAKSGRASDDGPTTQELAWAAALARAVELRTAVPDEHGSAVAAYAAGIAQRLGWSGGELALLRMAAMLRDVGKVSIPDRILQKPGPLTADEFEAIRTHPTAGAEIVGQVDGLSPVVEWIRHSHERVDGSGYPAGLCGDEIPLASRILLVAEAFEAITSRRAYDEARAHDDALAELWDNAGAQFDPSCVAALEQHLGGAPDGTPLATAAGR